MAKANKKDKDLNNLWKANMMAVNDSGLLEKLRDKDVTKTKMKQISGVSTNSLAKKEKNEKVSMETLGPISVAMQRDMDDVVEVHDDKIQIMSCYKDYGISEATIRNWHRLNTQPEERLTSRANKRKSTKRIIPVEYISNKENICVVQEVLDYIDENSIDILSAIFSLAISLLKKSGIYNKQHVAAALRDYSDASVIDKLTMIDLPDKEHDILGLIYQSYLQEGKKNTIGSYYTPQEITSNMTKFFDFTNPDTLFLDPCCGSGSFLLTVPARNPNQIFGIDNDRIAVLIAKTNLLLKYAHVEFIPQIYCLDYLMGASIFQQHPVFNKRFDYIATNPPWGAMADAYRSTSEITSKETFSCFFVKAYQQLKESGKIRFLFPESILNVKTHKDIRAFMLNVAGLISITTYEGMFTNVTTKYVDIECGKSDNKHKFTLYTDSEQRDVDLRTVFETKNLIFNLLSDEDMSIVRIVKERGRYSLDKSIWALGIVTGDNKGKLFSQCFDGMEKIYTGKEILPYVLKPAKNYILYDRNNLQQVAKDEIYRAPEKLAYKFISNKLVFAYDNSASLFLNSANILIPNVPMMSIKTVSAFLNSTLFQYMYIKLFGEVKVLKGNLCELPFPEISSRDNTILTTLVDDLLSGNNASRKDIENYIFEIYNLNDKQISYIRSVTNGKVVGGIKDANFKYE